MQSDIQPPDARQNKNIAKVLPMRSLRLQGHSFAGAKKRLLGIGKTPDLNAPKPEATIALGDKAPSIKHPWQWLKHHLNKRSKIELIVLSVILVLGTTAAGLIAFHHPKKVPVVVYKPVIVKPAAPTTVPSPLSGVQVAPFLAKRPVTGIMIENSPDARPQSGLQDAGVVYEAIAEGGITRFMALYQDTGPQYIGPVRSLRPYFLDFATPYQASIAHVGGSPDALATVRNGNYRDIDQFFNSGFYSRISSRAAPHNVYTDFARLDQLNQAKGYTSSKYTPWLRKADKPVTTPTAAHIDVQISSSLYYSHYDYDKGSNSYIRYEGGQLHKQVTSEADKTGVQINPKVILALVMNYSVIDSAGHSGYVDTGSGQMFAFQDGTTTPGTWNKADQASMFVFKDSAGKPMPLDAGQTWVVIVGSPANVTSSP